MEPIVFQTPRARPKCRRGGDDETWKAGKMPFPAAAPEGVGDSAVWVEQGRELDAQKNDLLCVAHAGGSTLNTIDLQKKLAGPCNTIFARIGL